MEQTQEHLSKVATENTEKKEALDKVIADNQAICEFAGFQPFIGNDEVGLLFYLEAKEKDGIVQNISICKEAVSAENAIFDKDVVLDALKVKMSNTFPEYIIETSGYDVAKHEDVIHIQEQRVANRVAMQTRRGAANTKFLDFLYYKGSHQVDAPFIVYKFGEKYGIFTHPKADQYGYRLIRK